MPAAVLVDRAAAGSGGAGRSVHVEGGRRRPERRDSNPSPRLGARFRFGGRPFGLRALPRLPNGSGLFAGFRGSFRASS